jgi:hypothetical protein
MWERVEGFLLERLFLDDGRDGECEESILEWEEELRGKQVEAGAECNGWAPAFG